MGTGRDAGVRAARATAAAVALLAAAGAGPAAGGQFYRFVDGDGVAHFTNQPPADSRYVRISLRPERRPRPVPRHWQYDGLIQLTAMEHDLPPALLKAVIAAESNFRPAAVSRKGAQGLMQLMPDTARDLGVDDPFHPTDNVRAGARYLRALVDRYDSLDHALAAYNAGPSAVDRYGGVPPFPETRDYVERVLNYYRAYYGDFGR